MIPSQETSVTDGTQNENMIFIMLLLYKTT